MNVAEPLGKARRQRAILEVLREEAIPSQDDLARALRRLGFRVTQATLSRDLKELGVGRAPEGDGYRYAVSMHDGTDAAVASEPAGRRLRSVAAAEVTGIEANEVAVIVRTLTGRAQGVGVVIDGLRLPDALGTLAGDDTVLVIPRSVRRTGRLKQELAEAFGLDAADRRKG
jgi:transcriptional regulator of arginine metabolism